MSPIRILVIAPYEGMAETFSQLAPRFPEVSLTIRTGNLEAGLKTARSLVHNNYDAIISRGGTAKLIRSELDIPVVEAPISVYDVLRSIKMAENYSGKFAIAGFSSLTDCAHILCDLLQYHVDIFTFEQRSDVMPALKSLRMRGYNLVICDMIGTIISSQLGISSILVSSGTESCENAINEVVQLISVSRHVHRQKNLLQAILTESDDDYLIYDPQGCIWFSTLSQSPGDQTILNMAQTYCSAFQKVPDQTIARHLEDQEVSIHNRHVYYEGQKYTILKIVRRSALVRDDDNSISIYNQPDNSSVYNPTYNTANYVGDTRALIDSFSSTLFPVLIIGEVGTGKDKTAELIYEGSPYKTHPLYTINCGRMNERRWSSLLTSENSPLNNLKTTIYFKDIGALSANQLEKLFTYFDHADLSKRNRLIFSYIDTEEKSPNKDVIYTYLTNRLLCMVLKIPPLRERIEDLPSITTLYINQTNSILGKQIIGFTPKAMARIQQFSWPNNLDQLHRVIHELASATKGPYIQEDTVSLILQKEEPAKAILSPAAAESGLDLHRPLEEINYDIIRLILQEENMNREKAASRLGISRSTLWRILKAHGEQ